MKLKLKNIDELHIKMKKIKIKQNKKNQEIHGTARSVQKNDCCVLMIIYYTTTKENKKQKRKYGNKNEYINA